MDCGGTRNWSILRMEKCLIWYQLSLKQNMRKLGTWVLLVTMLFLMWVVGHIHTPDQDNTTVAICFNGSNFEKEIKEVIEEGNAQFEFDEYDTAEAVSDAVESGKVECGFVFSEDFDSRIAQGDWEDVVTCYSTPFGTKTDVAKETLYGTLYPIYSRWLLAETENEIYSKEDPERLEQLLEKHDTYLEGALFLSFEEITIETEHSKTEEVLSLYDNDDSIYLTQGLVELFVLLSMLLAAGVYGQKETAQIESALLVREKLLFRYINILASGTILAGAGFFSILLSGESRGFWLELASMLGMLTLGGLLVYGFSKLFKNRLTYMSWVVTLVICFMLLRFGIASYITI